MAIALEDIVPFGRSADEYARMFALSAADLDSGIVGIGDGPASFNAEMSALGKAVISVDPLYCFSAEDIETRFHAVADDIIAQVRATPDDWVWSYHRSPEQLKANRLRALNRFTADFAAGKAQGRYRTGELPDLDFPMGRFALALCSHLLFLYSDHLSYDFHIASVHEMLRVADEVRIFPLLTLTGAPSPHLHPLLHHFERAGFEVALASVDYELQKGGNQMLRVSRAASDTRATSSSHPL